MWVIFFNITLTFSAFGRRLDSKPLARLRRYSVQSEKSKVKDLAQPRAQHWQPVSAGI